MLKAVFAQGVDEIYVHGLTQWDRGQVLQLTCPDLPSSFQVHFENKKSETALVVQAESVDNVATIIIPDEMLRLSLELFAYLYFDEGLIGETVKTICMPIKPRAKPDDYIIDLSQEQATEAEKLVQKMIGAYADTAVHQPIIQDGTWWTWDASAEQYVDTRTTAEGKDGVGIKSIAVVGSGATQDGSRVTARWTKYRITFDDDSIFDYTVVGGADGADGTPGEGIADIAFGESTDEGNVYYIRVGNMLYPFTAPIGPAGKTPVKGTDYWTEDDKVEIVQEVMAQTNDGNVSSTDVDTIAVMDQAEFDALTERPNTTLYVIRG